MNYFQPNMEAMENNHTHGVKALLMNADAPKERTSCDSRSDVPFYQYYEDGRWRNLVSAYSPTEEASRQCDVILKDTEVSLCFVLGEAGLFHVEEILNRVSPKTLVVLISNNPSYVKLVLQTRDLRKMLSDYRLVLAVSSSDEEIKRIVSDVIVAHPRHMPTFAVFEHPIESKIQTSFFRDVQEYIAWIYRTLLVNFSTTAQFEEFWAENFMSNIPYIVGAKVADDFKNSWENKPIIIVGAGPSLQKNIHVLRKAKGNCLIFCVDTAYRIMQKHGIEPDLIVTVDGTPTNAKHLEGCNYHDLPLVADCYSHYDILRNHQGTKVFLDSIGFHSKWWSLVDREQPSSTLASGGSVATIAFSFARALGANPVVMTGVDLSYTNGKYYADGAVNADVTIEDIKKTREVIELTDIHGQPVYTTNDYFYYLKWFEKQAKNADRTYINATEGGALKDGFSIQPLEEVVEQYCSDTLDVKGWVTSLAPNPISQDRKSRILKNIKKSYLESKALVRYSNILIELLYKFISRLEQGKYTDLSELVDTIEKGHKKTMELQYALSFVNGHSLKIAWKDSLVENAIKDGRVSLSQKDIAIVSARRTIDLFSNFNRLAKESVQSHRNGLKFLEEYLIARGTEADERVSRIS